MEIDSFEVFVHELLRLSSSRDPRQARLSSVASAIFDVIKSEGLEINAARVYAKASIVLEGTLQKKHEEIDHLVDSIYTQIALLELLDGVLPKLDTSTVLATFVPIGRTIRNLMTLMRSIHKSNPELDIKDDSGCVVSLLCSAGKTSSTLLQCFSKSPKNSDDKALRQFFRDTILQSLVSNSNQKVENNAGREIGDLLRMTAPKCHPTILRDINFQIQSALESIAVANYPAQRCGEMMGILDVTRSNIMHLDAAVGQKLMLVLVALIQRSSATSDDFVMKTRDSSSFVLVINVLLSAVENLLESDSNDEMLNDYATRVLATLLQVEPSLILRGADEETSSAGRELLAQVMLSSAKRVVNAELSKASALLPLVIGRLFALAGDQEYSDETIQVQRWFLELTQIIHVKLPEMKRKDLASYQKCCEASFDVARQMLGCKQNWIYQGALICLAELALQNETQPDKVTSTIRSLISRRSRLNPTSPGALALDDAMCRIVQGLGIDEFWHRVDIPKLCSTDNCQNYSWLLIVMRLAGPPTGVGCTSLAFFQDEVVPLARQIDNAAANKSGNSNAQRLIVVELWSLLQCFCVRPNDLMLALPKIASILARAMKDKRYPELLTSISGAIDVMATSVHRRVVEAAELLDQPEFDAVRDDAAMMKGFSEKMLPTLFKLVDDLYCSASFNENVVDSNDDVTGTEMKSGQADSLTGAITSLAKLAPRDLLQNRLFTGVMHRLVEASQAQEDLSAKMCSLLSLSQALYSSGCLSEASTVLLYRALRPLIGTDETMPKVQKRSYKLLAELCKSNSFVTGDGRLKELVELLTSSTSTSQIAARSMRLRCISTIITGSLSGSSDLEDWVLASLLGEILLCMKDSKNKTRELATSLLISISNESDVLVLVRGIAAAVASETSHMRSAAVTALSKLVLEHGKVHDGVLNLMPSLIKTVLLLSADPSREVSKSMIVFIRVSIAVCPPDMIQPLLPEILQNLLAYHKGLNRFRGKVKITIKKLMRIFGDEHLLSLIEEHETQNINYIKKLAKAEAKPKKKSRKAQMKSKSVEEMMASDEEDSEDDMTAPIPGGRRRKRYQSEEPTVGTRNESRILIRNDSAAGLEVRDLSQMVGQTNDESDSDDDGGVTFDEHGRLVVSEPTHDTGKKPEEYMESLRLDGNFKERNSETNGGRKQQQRKKKLGDAYRSKKAGGDVKRKGQKFDPYAYVPLDGKSYTKKNRRQAVEQLDTVVRGRKRQKR